MTTTDPVLFHADDRGVATITLNRPDRLNAINLQMRDLLWTYVQAARELPDLRILVFRGEGRAFSAGADINEFGTSPSIIAARRARHERDLWPAILTLPIPTIARMHGFCFGAGLELPLCCDLRIASDDASFGLPEVTLGYIPSAGATQTLPRTIPPAVAAHMILTGEPIDSAAALRWGLVDAVAPAADLDRTLEALIETTLARPPADVIARRAALAEPRALPFPL
ncbi:MAG TPA: enoyl-CoA hydratase/isomerase family protein [Tepidiformaceae bacterium]|nr:enoyl-CoA hydratase/isomerase family protein [Tepidiformaceae bacterium]